MSEKAKNVNYTDAQVSALVEAYTACEDADQRDAVIEQFAGEFAKPVRSIRAKLVREGVYVKKTYTTKTGEKPESKADIVQDIAGVLACNVEAVESLEKATKSTLRLLRKALPKS